MCKETPWLLLALTYKLMVDAGDAKVCSIPLKAFHHLNLAVHFAGVWREVFTIHF